jgi:hypothetical protein
MPLNRCRFVVAHPQTVLWTPQTSNTVRFNFTLRLYKSVGAANTTALDLGFDSCVALPPKSI